MHLTGEPTPILRAIMKGCRWRSTSSLRRRCSGRLTLRTRANAILAARPRERGPLSGGRTRAT